MVRLDSGFAHKQWLLFVEFPAVQGPTIDHQTILLGNHSLTAPPVVTFFFNTYYSYTYSNYITTKYGSKLVCAAPLQQNLLSEALSSSFCQGSLEIKGSNHCYLNGRILAEVTKLYHRTDLSPQLDVSVQVLKSDHELYRMVGSCKDS